MMRARTKKKSTVQDKENEVNLTEHEKTRSKEGPKKRPKELWVQEAYWNKSIAKQVSRLYKEGGRNTGVLR